jgi:hypothetical protein
VPVLNYLSTTSWGRTGSGCRDPYFLGLYTSWRWVISFTPRPLYPRGKAPHPACAHWVGCRLSPRVILNNVKKRKFSILTGLELRSFCRPARSQWLYRLLHLITTKCKFVSQLSRRSREKRVLVTKKFLHCRNKLFCRSKAIQT